MRAVNLLPARQGGRSGPRVGGGRRPAFALAAVALAAGAGYWGWSAHSEASDLAGQVATAETRRNALDAQVQALLAVDQRATAQQTRRGVVVQLANSRINWERLVRGSVTVVPARVWLTQVTGAAPTAASAPAAAPLPGQPVSTSAAPQGLHVEGLAFGQPDVARFMARLDAVPGLGEPRLASADELERGGRTLIQFIIDVPVDRRAQDRPTLDVSAAPGTPGAPATAGGSGGFIP